MRWWECCECGEQTGRPHRPLRCDECGTAGPVFVRIDPEDVSHLACDDRRQLWMELGARWSLPLDELHA